MTTVATCNLLVEAQILQTTLGGSGITAFLPDELTAQTSGNVYAYAIGGIRVQVEDEDADAARAILAAMPPPETLPADVAPAQKINLLEKFALFNDHWSPRIVAELNGQHVKLVKFQGPFVWHQHAEEDELFLVVRGAFRMEFRDRTVELSAGELLVVPRGVEHRPVAEVEVWVLLFEPAATVNTGNNPGEKTVAQPGWI